MIAVAEGGAIYPLIDLLQSSSISCCEAAAWALKNIACHEENVKCICDGHGIQGLVSLLTHHISSQDQQQQQQQQLQATEALAPVPAQHWRLIEAIVSALGALTTTAENKYLIGHLGAIDSMVQLINEDTSERYLPSFLLPLFPLSDPPLSSSSSLSSLLFSAMLPSDSPSTDALRQSSMS
jgi:hypothetical protein